MGFVEGVKRALIIGVLLAETTIAMGAAAPLSGYDLESFINNPAKTLLSNASCTDSDNGLEYYIKGFVKGRNMQDEQYKRSDACISKNKLEEYYCDGDERAYQEYMCPYGCEDGACVIPNIIIIGWDGVQRDHFWECYNKELPECPRGLPHIKKLAQGKIFNNTVTSGDTCTKPGWAQILSGYDAEVMGIYSNGRYQPLPKGYSIFEKLEKHLGEDNIVTLFIAGKAPNVGAKCLGELGEKKGQPWCNAKKHIDYYENNMGNNNRVGEKALELLEQYKDETIFALFHLREPDNIGHRFGENSIEYSKAIIDDDEWLGKIMAKLKELGIYDQTLIYVTTDHGFDEDTRRHRSAPYGFLATNDPSIIRSGDRKDLAATILKKYGISTDERGKIPAVDGYPLDSIPEISCIPEGEAYVDYPDAPQCCPGLNLIGLDKFKKKTCTPATGGANDHSGYCTLCGDGECKKPENQCNCPQDCL